MSVEFGSDTDSDGLPDSVVLSDPLDLAIAADVDRDGLADVLVRFGPDGAATTVDLWSDLDQRLPMYQRDDRYEDLFLPAGP